MPSRQVLSTSEFRKTLKRRIDGIPRYMRNGSRFLRSPEAQRPGKKPCRIALALVVLMRRYYTIFRPHAVGPTIS